MKSCKEIMQLASDQFDKKLSVSERLGLFLHLRMCGACREAAAMLQTVHCRAQSCSGDDEKLASEECLSEESRSRIILELQKGVDE